MYVYLYVNIVIVININPTCIICVTSYVISQLESISLLVSLITSLSLKKEDNFTKGA